MRPRGTPHAPFIPGHARPRPRRFLPVISRGRGRTRRPAGGAPRGGRSGWCGSEGPRPLLHGDAMPGPGRSIGVQEARAPSETAGWKVGAFVNGPTGPKTDTRGAGSGTLADPRASPGRDEPRASGPE